MLLHAIAHQKEQRKEKQQNEMYNIKNVLDIHCMSHFSSTHLTLSDRQTDRQTDIPMNRIERQTGKQTANS